MINIKKKFISFTGRETLLYKATDILLFRIQSMFNALKKGHLIRKKIIKNYLKNHEKKKLHLGSGNDRLKGFLNSDAIGGEIHIDIGKKLPFKDNTFDLIYSNHLIEHIYRKDLLKLLDESKRILKNGGKLIIGTPDMKKIIKTFYEDDKERMKIISNKHEEFMFDKKFHIASYINDLSHIFFGHKYLYDTEYLTYLLSNSGYSNIQEVNNRNTSDETINKNSIRRKLHWHYTTFTLEAEKT